MLAGEQIGLSLTLLETQKTGFLKSRPSYSCFLISGITIPTTQGSPMVCQQGLKITEELVQRVEVVYVLGLFLLGKHRKKVSFYFHIVFNQNLKETCCDATYEFPQHVFFDGGAVLYNLT